MRLTLVPLFCAALSLAACAPEATQVDQPTGDKTYGDLPFWEGNTCVEIKPGGRRMVVPKSKCPPRA